MRRPGRGALRRILSRRGDGGEGMDLGTPVKGTGAEAAAATCGGCLRNGATVAGAGGGAATASGHGPGGPRRRHGLGGGQLDDDVQQARRSCRPAHATGVRDDPSLLTVSGVSTDIGEPHLQQRRAAPGW